MEISLNLPEFSTLGFPDIGVRPFWWPGALWFWRGFYVQNFNPRLGWGFSKRGVRWCTVWESGDWKMGVLVVTRCFTPLKIFTWFTGKKFTQKLIWFQSSPKHPPPPMTLGSMFILPLWLGFFGIFGSWPDGIAAPGPLVHPDQSRTMPSPLKTTRAAPGTEIQKFQIP